MSDAATQPLPGTSDERRHAMLAVARAMFLEHGYARTSMSAVAARIGGSKTTLWTYFPGKEALFLAVASDLIEEYAGHVAAGLVFDGPFDRCLAGFGTGLLTALTSPPVRALQRIVAAEAVTIPGLGLRFHEQGLAHGWHKVAAYLEQAQARGLVRAEADPLRAAQHLIGLLQSGCYQRHLMSDSGSPAAQTIAADVDAAVAAFCRAYGAGVAAGQPSTKV